MGPGHRRPPEVGALHPFRTFQELAQFFFLVLGQRGLHHTPLAGKGPELIKPVQDRKGHDRRYSLSSAKLRAMGWAPQVDFEEGLKDTVAWYQKNEWWWRPVKERDPGYKAYIEAQYGKR